MIGTTSEAIPGCETVNDCVCPGDQLTYRCTVQGSPNGATIWSGTAFSGCPQDDILLQHRQFTPTGGTTGSCNNGVIVGRSLDEQGNNYTSQLNVTITPETAGKTIMCSYDALDGQNIMIKFSTITPGNHAPLLYNNYIADKQYIRQNLVSHLYIMFLELFDQMHAVTCITAGHLSPPNKLFISSANFILRRLTFSWSSVALDCPVIRYNILASNCGSCPTTTNHTNVTCTDVPTENSVCTFAIQTVLCGSLIGNKSDPVIVTTTTLLDRINVDMCTNTAYLATISSLVVALITSVVVFTTAIGIILQRSKAKIKELQPPNREASSTHIEAEAMYEDPLPSVSAISTKENVAYGHAKKSTAAM